MTSPDLIVTALLAPESLLKYSEMDWDLLIRQGRRANLLARLAHLLIRIGLIDELPLSPRLHIISALRMVERQDVAIRWEVTCIQKALAKVGVPIILLKGAAYVMAGVPAAHGRTFSDIDILVPKNRLADVESELMLHGWHGSHHDDYDQQYYRRWMHEIPPMRHVKRGTTIDVHHTILPETGRIRVNTAALFRAAVALHSIPGLFVLQPEDMILHSAAHLFHEGGLENGLRDLNDLDSLFRCFGENDVFWDSLMPRAIELGLTRPLFYAIRYAVSVFNTPIPRRVVDAMVVGQPNALVLAAIDFCYRRALRPAHASCNTLATPIARFALYVRSHWLRMPMPLLVLHLARKAFRRPKDVLEEKPFLAEKQ